MDSPKRLGVKINGVFLYLEVVDNCMVICGTNVCVGAVENKDPADDALDKIKKFGTAEMF